VIAPALSRPWHAVWPSHVPVSIEYPRVPAWWLLERNLDEFGRRLAILELDHETLAERRALTYDALWDAVRGMATGLRAKGVARGSHVGLCLPNSAALIAGYYATWYSGGVAVPMNPSSRESEIEQQVVDAGVSHVIAPEESAGARVASRLGLIHVGMSAFREMESLPPAVPADCPCEDDAAVLLYTGGTTGVPKGAVLTHRNVVANTIQFARWYAFEPGGETAFCALPMYHSGGMSGAMNVPLSAAATLLVLSRFNAPAAATAVGRHRVTRLFGVPTMFIALLNHPAGRSADYSSLRACRTNAAPLPPSVKAEFDALVGREVLVEGYGLTETSPLTHANPVGRAKAGSIGVPLPDTDARIVDLETGADVDQGAPGELLIRGPQVMKGYWRKPDATAQAISDGWFRTGDVATMDAEGYFAIVDRKKDMINTAGFKVWPREVEETLYEHPAIKLAAVIGVPDDYRGEAVKACVVLKDGHGGAITEGEVIEFCRARLTSYKAPRIVEFRNELPLTGTGKMLRRELRARAPEGAA
jgi:long-chain acyl-CoA synthetase